MTWDYVQLAVWLAMTVYLVVATVRWLCWKELCKATERDWKSAEERADHFFSMWGAAEARIKGRDARSNGRIERMTVLQRSVASQCESILSNVNEMVSLAEKDAESARPEETTSK